MNIFTKCFISIMLLMLSATASAGSWQYVLSQQGRNAAILAEANNQKGKTFPYESKAWVQNVVLKVSSAYGTPRQLPQNSSDGWEWTIPPSVTSVMRRYVTPQQFLPGDIVQMKIHYKDGSYGPHTAIVLSVTSSEITWIDENYTEKNTVGTHKMSFYQFSMLVPSNNYSVYEVW